LPDRIAPTRADALLVTDMQRDFLPGGSLPVAGADAIVPVLNRYLGYWTERGFPVFATRCWHPRGHCSFVPLGRWPPHCIAGTAGAEFTPELALPPMAVVVSKADRLDRDAYSSFDGTDLDRRLRAAGVRRLFVGGVATDFCVCETVKDARAAGYATVVLADAVRAIDDPPGSGRAAEDDMRARGAVFVSLDDLA
jgi:nicotinamidase/pyrazinamidase